MDSIWVEGAVTIGEEQGFKPLHVVHDQIEIATEGGAPARMPTMTTKWRLGVMELAALVGGASLTITLWGRAHPPIVVAVEPEIPGYRIPRGYLIEDLKGGKPTYTEDKEIIDASDQLGYRKTPLYE